MKIACENEKKTNKKDKKDKILEILLCVGVGIGIIGLLFTLLFIMVDCIAACNWSLVSMAAGVFGFIFVMGIIVEIEIKDLFSNKEVKSNNECLGNR